MDWEDYRKTYKRFTLSLNQTRLATLTATEVLRDFPASLPDGLHGHINSLLVVLAASLQEAQRSVQEDASNTIWASTSNRLHTAYEQMPSQRLR